MADLFGFVPAMGDGQHTAAHKLIKSIELGWIGIAGILLATFVFTPVLGSSD